MRISLITLLVAAVASITVAEARGPVDISYTRPSLDVLGLYDSTDESNRGIDVILRSRARRALAQLGLRLTTHDVAQGLPSAERMSRFRAVLTAFDDAQMLGAGEYARWLHAQLDAGRRIVVLNNFGAYQDAETQEWVGWDQINGVFKRLGVLYDAQWTGDPNVLQIIAQSAEMFRSSPRITPERAAHYYRFKPVAADLEPHLIVNRIDIAGGESAVVFTSPRGGMAMTRYYEDRNGREQVRLTRFLDKALFPQQHHSRRVLFVLDPESSAGHTMERSLHWILQYSRIDADFILFRDFGRLRRRDLRKYGSLVLASYDGGALGEGQALSDIERWVHEDGGGLVALFPTYHPRWRTMLGIHKWSESTQKVTAIRYTADFFPGMRGLFVRGESYQSDVTKVTLHRSAKAWAYGALKDDDTVRGPPVLWSHRHGKGRVLFRNDSILGEKVWRGSVLQMVLQSMPVSAAPIVNSMVYYIDDCPQPMWDVRREPIQTEFNLSDTDFYMKVWWPDMMRLVQEFSLKLTFVLIFSYDDQVSEAAPFTADPFYSRASKGVPEWMAREAVRLGHEVALHGYNHQSLVRDGGYTSRGWGSLESMVDGLLLARREWERLFGKGQAPFTYIAPNNHIHRAGKEAVGIAFPEIRVMSSQYLNEGDLEGQEFQVDPDADRFMDIPRVSSEFYTGSHNNVPMLDAVMLLGAWTHFVHPDDVFDPERNGGLNWGGLYEASRKMLSHMRTSYPWLKSMRARDAYHEMVRFRTGGFSYDISDDKIVLQLGDASDRPSPFVLRVDPSTTVETITSGRLLHAYPELGYYYIEGFAPTTIVGIKR